MKKIRLPVTILVFLFWLNGCETPSHNEKSGFTYQKIPVTKDSALAGSGASINFRGQPLALTGTGIAIGDSLRPVQIATKDLSLLDLADTRGKIRIISVVPSLDTKVCEQQTHYLSEKSHGLDSTIDLYTISVDTPFAQQRFAKEANIANVTFLSDFRGGEFGRTHGLLLEQPHLLARAMLVVDENNIIQHLQITPDLGNMPDMDAAFKAARDLGKAGPPT